MVDFSELVDGFLKSRVAGISDAHMREEALSAGWSATDIDAAFSIIASKVPHGEISPVTSVTLAPISSARSFKVPVFIGIGVLGLILIGGVAYMYVEKMGPFAKAPYQEDNLFSGLLTKSSEIDSSAYKVGFALYTKGREADAKPFTLEIKDSPEIKEKYLRDSERAESVNRILSTLQEKARIPSSINGLKPAYEEYGDNSLIDITDPRTNAQYAYKTTDGGTDFALEVTFETDDALSAIRDVVLFQIQENATLAPQSPEKIEGNKVTFTKSSGYLYLPSEPPKAFLEQLSEYAMYIPPEINIQSSVSVVAGKNVSNGDSFDWKFGLDGSGDLGDLSYKVNVEALKYARDYYVKINNMPALFGSFLPPKGQWVRFNASSSDEAGFITPFISQDIAQAEEDFKDSRVAFVALIKKTAEFADKERLFSFKNKPQKEKVGERSLYRYDLSMRKEAIVPFYKKFAAEAVKAEYKDDDIIRIDEGYLKYLESSEFSEMFDYYNKNISVTLWVDQKGFPAMLKYTIRIVPPDDVATLKDKQFMLEFTISLDDINEPLRIDRPEGSKTYEEVMKEKGNPLGKFIQRVKSSTLEANLGSLFR